ncbi:MAG: ribose operon repressor [Chloroflexota bacterium]|nr:LacI family transcriptional regulator [Chloroflexota bacterium]NOG63975.1 LacI family DNA-binding transcriptional regulator [Chloroflexota bacterium]GIK65721.1 MAG: ribose operon repressor [Chloroflexota bacterium]
MPSIIEQIASELNISNASVSRALNDRPGVGKELRERILQRARDLNYTPSLTARGLATSQTFAIGFFVHEKPNLSTQTDPFYGEILHGVEQVCAETDYHISIATLTDSVLASPLDFRFVRERRIDGMILAGPDIPNSFVMAMLQSGVPVVLVDNKLDHSPINCVNSDDDRGAYLAAKHLLELGHHSIGLIAGPEHWASNARRVWGYTWALQEVGLTAPIIHVDRTTIDSGKAAYYQLISEHPEITAIGAVNDSMAIGAIRAAQDEGRRIPEDLSIIGFDDIEWAAHNSPSLTTINIPKRQMGKEAARRLLSLLDDPEAAPTEIIVSVQLVKRESTQERS